MRSVSTAPKQPLLPCPLDNLDFVRIFRTRKLAFMCPRCGQNAPAVLRGLRAYCSVCGASYTTVTGGIVNGSIVNVAGKPSRWGGKAARVAGWSVLALGLSLALLVGALGQAIFPNAIVGYVLGGLIAVGALAVASALVIGGRTLEKSGAVATRAVQEQTLAALAGSRGGTITAADAARALDVNEEEADLLLSELAKRPDDRVSLEVDESGGLYYVFRAESGSLRVPAEEAAARVRVEPARENGFESDAGEEWKKAKGPEPR